MARAQSCDPTPTGSVRHPPRPAAPPPRTLSPSCACDSSAAGVRAGLQTKIGELEAELQESEARRKAGASGGPRTLRDSEDKYLREERLKDDLDIARKQKIELEAALLDRDARAIENRFDLEAKEQEMSKRLVESLSGIQAAVAAWTVP